MRTSWIGWVFVGASAVLSSACAEPEAAYCGGFDPSIIIDLSVQRLTLNVSDTRPVQAEVCPFLPRECPCLSTDENGFLRARLPADTEVLVELRAPRYQTTVATATFGSIDRGVTARLADRTTVNAIARVLGEAPDPARGHIAFRTAPADDGSVVGTRFTVRNLDTGDEVRVAYLSAGLPSWDAPGTDDTGSAFVVNVEPGRYRIESPVLPTCGLTDAGWPRYDESGDLEAIETVVHADAITLIDVLRCGGSGG